MNAIGDATLALGLVLLIWQTGTLEYGGVFAQVGLPVDHDGEPRRARPPRRRRGEVGPDPAAHVASRCDGRADAGLGAHPRGDDGDGGGLPARPREPDLRGRPRRAAPRLDPRRRHAARRRAHRARAVGHQARDRVLDDVPDRLHVPGGGDRRVRLRDLPPDDARLLQGAPVHVGRARDPPPGRGAGHPEDGRAPDGDAAHPPRVPRRRAVARRHPDLLRLLVEGRHRRRGVRERRRARRRAVRRRTHRGAPHRPLHLPALLRRLPRRAERAREGARARGPRRGTDAPCSSPSRRCRCSRRSAASS